MFVFSWPQSGEGGYNVVPEISQVDVPVDVSGTTPWCPPPSCVVIQYMFSPTGIHRKLGGGAKGRTHERRALWSLLHYFSNTSRFKVCGSKYTQHQILGKDLQHT